MGCRALWGSSPRPVPGDESWLARCNLRGQVIGQQVNARRIVIKFNSMFDRMARSWLLKRCNYWRRERERAPYRGRRYRARHVT
jgi:hypothetical protein